MSDLVYGDPRIDGWVANKLGIRQWGESYSIANVRDSTLLGASVFHNYYPECGVVEISSYGENPKWMSRKMINAVFTHAFEGLKCQLVVLRVSENNLHMRNIAERLLFNSYTIPRLRGRNEADVIYTLSDDDWAKSRYRSH